MYVTLKALQDYKSCKAFDIFGLYNYRDVYDMAEQLQNEIIEKFNEIVENYEPKKQTDELFPMLVELFNLLADNSVLAKVLISKNGDAVFVEKLIVSSVKALK